MKFREKGVGYEIKKNDRAANSITKRGLIYERLAPTNMAAKQIGGSTIHKFLSIDEDNTITKQYVQRLCRLDCVLIDEISMVNSKILSLFQIYKNTSTKTKFIFIGDFRQLPPVMEENKDNSIDILVIILLTTPMLFLLLAFVAINLIELLFFLFLPRANLCCLYTS
jgi:hypothetical protein